MQEWWAALVAEVVRVVLLPGLAQDLVAGGAPGAEAQVPGLMAIIIAFTAVFAALSTVVAGRGGATDARRGLARVRAGVFRALAVRLAFLPLRDPDAKGRRRPRAPGRAALTSA